MNGHEFSQRLYESLSVRSNFRIRKVDDCRWNIESPSCCISLIFDRYGEGGPVITISEVASVADEMNIFALRHIRKATDALPDSGSPENIALVLEKNFKDLLAGDFSIRGEYDKLGRRFYALALEVRLLPDGDPIKQKYRAYDIGWLEDLVERKAASHPPAPAPR